MKKRKPFHIDELREFRCGPQRRTTPSGGGKHLARAMAAPNGTRACGFEGCGRLHYAKGLCMSHDAQRRRGDRLTVIGSQKVSTYDRFMAKVNKAPGNDGCWIWTGARNQFGHGQAVFHGNARTNAHRASWELHNGRVPDGLFVCHNCPGGDNPACVRPSHMFLGTAAENIADMYKKGRGPRGESSGAAVLTEGDVLAIRMLASGGTQGRTLARHYGVSKATISRVVNRASWSHLP